jgi:aryl-alcohol dehydrogenase-like predicted oxidoreductase
LSSLGLGTAQLGLPYGVSNTGGQPSEAEAGAIVRCALEGGIETIDTAPAYGGAEALLGRVLPAGRGRVVTKTEPLPGAEVTAAAGEAVRRSAERSLQRLRRDRIDGLLVHHGSDLARPGAARLADCLAGLREAGLVGKVGVSVYDRAELDAARDLLPLEIVQLPLSALDQRFLHDGTLAELRREGIEVHVRSVFLQGLLLMDPAELPEHLGAARQALRAFRELGRSHGLGPLETAFAAVRDLPGVDVVLVGANSVVELAACIAAMDAPAAAGLAFDEMAVEDPAVVDPRRWPA